MPTRPAQAPATAVATVPEWKAWWLAIRPPTLWCAVAPVLVATALAGAGSAARWPALLGCAAVALLIQIGTNLFNDYADAQAGSDTAARLGAPRAVASGWLTSQQVWMASVVTFVLAAMAGLWVVAQTGRPSLVLIGLLCIVAGFAYSGGPYPLAYHGLGDVAAFVFFGWVATVGSYFVHTHRITMAAWLAGSCMGALAAAVLCINNLRDRIEDTASGKHTLAVYFGDRFTRWQYSGLLGLAYGLLLLGVLFHRLPSGWLLPWLGSPIAWRLHRQVQQGLAGGALNQVLKATARLQLLFAVLLGLGVMAGAY